MISEKLSKTQFAEILNQYKIGDFVTSKYIDIAVENLNYKLKTSRGLYVLKVYESNDQGALIFQNKLINYLESKGVKVAPLIKSKTGNDLINFNSRYASIFKYIDGKHEDNLTKEICQSMGREIGLLHLALSEYKIDPKEIHADKLTEISENLNAKQLRKSVIHGDLSKTNILIDKNEVTAILDYNDAHYDYTITDLGCLIPNFLNDDNLKNLPLFFMEYEKRFKLNSEEKKFIPYFVSKRINDVIRWTEDKINSEKYRPSQLPHLEKGLRAYKEKLKKVDLLQDYIKSGI